MSATVTALLLLPAPPRWLLALAAYAVVAVMGGMVLAVIQEMFRC